MKGENSCFLMDKLFFFLTAKCFAVNIKGKK